jgi:cold shock CspA family protein
MLGRVDILLKAKGFGFILCGTTRYFMHARKVEPRLQFDQLAVGDMVTFDVGQDAQGPTEAQQVQCARLTAEAEQDASTAA